MKLHRKLLINRNLIKQRINLNKIELKNEHDFEEEEITDQIKEIIEKDSIDSFIYYCQNCPSDNLNHALAIFNKLLANMTDSYKRIYKFLPSSSKSYLPEEINEIIDDFFVSPPNSPVYLTNLSLFLSTVFDFEG